MSVWTLIAIVFTFNGLEFEVMTYGRNFESEKECMAGIEELSSRKYPADVYLACRQFHLDKPEGLKL